MNKPVFRKSTNDQLENELISYHFISKNWRRLIELTRFRDSASLYSLRRDCENAFNDILHLWISLVELICFSVFVSVSVRMQIMKHSKSDTFDKIYKSQSILWNVQNTFSKSNLEIDLVKLAISTATLTRDSKVFTRLTDEQKYELISQHFEMIVAREKQLLTREKCVRKHDIVNLARQNDAVEYQNFHEFRNHHRHLKIKSTTRSCEEVQKRVLRQSQLRRQHRSTFYQKAFVVKETSSDAATVHKSRNNWNHVEAASNCDRKHDSTLYEHEVFTQICYS